MRRVGTGYRLLAVGLVASLALGACSSRKSNESSSGGTSATTGAGGSAAFSIDTSKCESYNGTQGVSDTEIKIGASLPLSGIYATAFAAVNKGYKAYFDYINSQGGVKGHKINLISLDDAYNAGNTKANVDKLIQQEKVFATFNVIGTANNLSFRDEYNAVDSQCVPNLFVGTGSEKWGETDKYPWIIGSLPAYATEAAVFVDYLKKNNPQAKIGLLKQNDDFGASYEAALKKAIEGTDITLVGTQAFNAGDQDPTPQITALSSSGADTLFIGVTGLPCASAMKAAAGVGNWKPVTYVSLTCTSQVILNIATDSGANPGVVNGVVSTGYLMDPDDPTFADKPDMQQYKQLAAQQGLSQSEIDNGYTAYGWLMGELLVSTLEKAPALERKAVMETAYTLDKLKLPLLRDGVTISTNGATDPFPVESLYVLKFDSSAHRWVEQGGLIDLEGKTRQFIPGG